MRRRESILFGCNSARSPSATASAARPAQIASSPMELFNVVLIFSPNDFDVAKLAHRPFDREMFPRTEYVSDPPLTLQTVVTTPQRNVAAFIGACLFRDIFQIEKNGMEYGTTEWDDECWHWNVYSEGKVLPRDALIENIKRVKYHGPDGQVIKSRVVVLRRDAHFVQRIGEFIVQGFGEQR